MTLKFAKRSLLGDGSTSFAKTSVYNLNSEVEGSKQRHHLFKQIGNAGNTGVLPRIKI